MVFWVKQKSLNRDTKEVLDKSSWKKEGEKEKEWLGRMGGERKSSLRAFDPKTRKLKS